jgi:hypothetical protein
MLLEGTKNQQNWTGIGQVTIIFVELIQKNRKIQAHTFDTANTVPFQL